MPTCWAFSAESRKLCEQKGDAWGSRSWVDCLLAAKLFLTVVSAVDTVFATVLPTTVEKAEYTSYSA